MGSQRRRKVKEEQLVGELLWVARWDGKKRGKRASWSDKEDEWLKQGGYQHCIKKKDIFLGYDRGIDIA